MELNFDTTNNEILYIISIAIDREISNFNQIEFNDNYILFKNDKDKISLLIEEYKNNSFKATINSKFFKEKTINNWMEFVNCLSINNLFLEQNFNLN